MRTSLPGQENPALHKLSGRPCHRRYGIILASESKERKEDAQNHFDQHGADHCHRIRSLLPITARGGVSNNQGPKETIEEILKNAEPISGFFSKLSEELPESGENKQAAYILNQVRACIEQEAEDKNIPTGMIDYDIVSKDGILLREHPEEFTTVKFWGEVILNTAIPQYTIVGRMKFDGFVFDISTVFNPTNEDAECILSIIDASGQENLSYTFADLQP